MHASTFLMDSISRYAAYDCSNSTRNNSKKTSFSLPIKMSTIIAPKDCTKSFFCAPIILKKFVLIKTGYYRRKNSSVLKSVFLSILQVQIWRDRAQSYFYRLIYFSQHKVTNTLSNSLIEIAPHCKWTSWSNWWP